MAVFDPIVRRLFLRVVYDGPGFAGKTTNVERITELVPSNRRTELYTPGALKGRTMFFDWLEIEGGKLGSMDVRVQILSVPGQAQRSYRRRPLLMSADTVVFVADSTAKGLEESKRSFALLTRYLRERGDAIPVLVQANKQDVEGALAPDDVVAYLKKSETLPVIGASAQDGTGVRETLAHAMRLAIRDVKDRVGREGIAKITGTNETADGLFDRLLEIEEQHLLALDAEPAQAPHEAAGAVPGLGAEEAAPGLVVAPGD